MKGWWAASACLAILLTLSYSLHAEEGLLVHYTFDEGAGEVVRDKSGNGHDGKIVGAVWVKGIGGPALEFHGRGDYIDLGRSPALNRAGDTTVAAWLKLSARPFPNTNTNWVVFENEGGGGGCILRIDGTRSVVGFRTSGGSGSKSFESAVSLVNGRYCHLALVRHGSRATLYVDGCACGGADVGQAAPSTAPFYVSDPVQSFSGLMEDFRVYDRALSAEEICRVYAAVAATVNPWVPTGGDERAARIALMADAGRPNLAERKNGCWVVTSSNANLWSLYSENLNDGNPNTLWRSYQPTREEYVELKWDFEMSVDTVQVFQHEESHVTTFELQSRQGDAWTPIATRSGPGGSLVEFKAPPTRTRALRVVMRNDRPRYSGLYEIRVFGPEQAILRIDPATRWTYLPAGASAVSGAPESVVLDAVSVTPANPTLGGRVQLALSLKPTARLSKAYALALALGDREILPDKNHYSIARFAVPMASESYAWEEGVSHTLNADLVIPQDAPDGQIGIYVQGVCLSGGPPLKLLWGDGSDIAEGKIADVSVRRFPGKFQPDAKTHAARVDTSTGGTCISIDGRKVPPVLFALNACSFDRYQEYSQKAGVKLFHIQAGGFKIDVGDYQKIIFDRIARSIRNLLRIEPGAYVIVQMDMRTSPAWQDANPDDCLRMWDGRRMHESFCSRKYCDEARSHVGNMVKFAQSQPWGNRVIGYLVEIGEPEGVLSGGPDIGDYSSQGIEAFREFVRTRYGTAEALREAYGDPALTFEKAYPDREKMIQTGAKGGCFLDPATQRLVIDYHEFLSSLVPSLLMDCGRVIKAASGGRALVGSYWAYLLEDLCWGQYSHQRSHSYLHNVLASPYLDFFASPFNYWYPSRHAGDPYRPFQAYDTLRVNGKIHIAECDQRTFRTSQLLYGRHHSRQETLSLIRRDTATALMHGMGMWFSDWSANDFADRRQAEPWFEDDEILAQISSLRQTYERTIALPRGKTQAEAAIFTSGTSYYFHDNNAKPIYEEAVHRTAFYNIPMSGVPVDELIFEDILKPEVQKGYKCFVFINAFYMTPDQRRAVEGLKREGRTLVWLYAPGYVSDTGLATAGIESVTGFRVGIDHTKQPLTYRLEGGDSEFTRLAEDVPYGGQSGPVSPRFFIHEDPGIKVIGRYADGKTALAARDFGSYKSVYCTSPYVPTAVFRNIARWAGCHVYVDQEMYLDATDDFLMLTNSFQAEREVTVRLPARKDVFDLESGKPTAQGVDALRIVMQPGETVLYRLR